MAANSPSFIWYMKFIATMFETYKGDWAFIYYCDDCDTEYRFKPWAFDNKEFCVFCYGKNVRKISKGTVC